MVSEVGVCNEALALIGEPSITSIDPPDANNRARLCQTLFDQARDAVLRDFDWNFASEMADLGSALTTVPTFGYTAAFSLPTDPYCLRVLETNHPDSVLWRVQGRQLFINETSVQIRYTARVLDTSLWSPDFAELLALHLASKLAYPLSRVRGLGQDHWKLYLKRRDDMLASDSQEGSPPQPKPTRLELVR